jgi:hypothetical protein
LARRVGRIDRLGQRFPNIQIINLHYSDTVETDVYRALRQRIGLFETVVGRLQPILARLPALISSHVLEGRTKPAEERQAVVSEIEAEADRAQASGFDIDEVTDAVITEPVQPPSPLTMGDLERVIALVGLLPPGVEVEAMGPREYKLRQPGMREWVRVSTNPAYYEEHADNVELWSPGNPTFPKADALSHEVSAKRFADVFPEK